MGNNVGAGSLDGPQGSKPRADQQAGPKFDLLLVGHDSADPPEATLVLAAVAAHCGYRADGDLMPGGANAGRPPSLRELADELGLCVGAVRRGVAHLETVGAATRTAEGVQVVPAALAARWADRRRRIRLIGGDRRRGVRAEPLLLAGLVRGQADERGRLALGIGYLSERTGLPPRTVQRTLATAERAGLLHRWTAPIGGGRLMIAPGPSRSGAREALRSGAREAESSGGHREVAHPPVSKWRAPRREVAHPPSQSGARHPEVHPDVLPDSPPDALPRAEGETGSAPPVAAAEPQPAAELAPKAKPKRDPIAEVERWAVAMTGAGIERMDPKRHAADVAGLLDLLGTDEDVRDRAAVRADRRKLATRAVAWCPSPERLAQWLVSVRREFGAQNLAGYLRAAVDNGGDPGTLLGSHLRNVYGQGAEQFQHFTPATEQALEGEHAHDVAAIVDATGDAMRLDDMGHRAALRSELQRMLAAGRNAAARQVLLQLVGDDRSDLAVARAIADVCTLDVARELLAA